MDFADKESYFAFFLVDIGHIHISQTQIIDLILKVAQEGKASRGKRSGFGVLVISLPAVCVSVSVHRRI